MRTIASEESRWHRTYSPAATDICHDRDTLSKHLPFGLLGGYICKPCGDKYHHHITKSHAQQHGYADVKAMEAAGAAVRPQARRGGRKA